VHFAVYMPRNSGKGREIFFCCFGGVFRRGVFGSGCGVTFEAIRAQGRGRIRKSADEKTTSCTTRADFEEDGEFPGLIDERHFSNFRGMQSPVELS
jgi:hypothetical protein